jgi:hypothetical protein
MDVKRIFGHDVCKSVKTAQYFWACLVVKGEYIFKVSEERLLME